MTTHSKVNRFGRLAFICLSLLLIMTFIAAALPGSASAAACKFKHTVKAGESLIIIANLYQADWQEIADANDLKEPYALTVGQVLCIPDGVAPGSDPDSDTDGGKPALTGIPAFMGTDAQSFEVPAVLPVILYRQFCPEYRHLSRVQIT